MPAIDPESSEFVFVYRYLYWDEATQSRKVSTVRATEEALRNGLGRRMDGGAMQIRRSDLRDGGIYVAPQ